MGAWCNKLLKVQAFAAAFVLAASFAASAGNFTTPTAPYPTNASGAGLYLKWRADGQLAGDNFGFSLKSAGDVDGDGKEDIIVGAYNADPGGRANAGSAYVYSSATGLLLYQFDGAVAADALGYSVNTAGDVNGDGRADVIFGAHGYDLPGANAGGRAYVYSGMDGSLLYQKDGAATNTYVGIAVSTVGDLNADGRSEFIIGAQQASPASGTIYIYSGIDGSLYATKTGTGAGDQYGGFTAAAGDINGDGIADYMVGAVQADPGAILNAGSAYVYSGADGSLLYQKNGPNASDAMGSAIASAGDVNGDGRTDFIVGAFGYDTPALTAGTAFVYSGMDGSVLYQKTGSGANAQMGRSAASMGDTNADGKSEFILGSVLNNGTVYVYNGADGNVLFQKDGAMSADYFGYVFASPGDVNGDGKPDLVVSAYNADPSGMANAGSVYFFFTDYVAPVVMNNQTGDDTWRASDPGAIYDVDFSDGGGANLDYVQYSVWTGPNMTGTNTITWTNIASGIASTTYTSNWSVAFTSLAQGQSYVSVRAVDYASNTTVATDAFYIKKDTSAPSVTDNQAGDATWRNSNSGTYDVDFSDASSGLDKLQVNACTANSNCTDIIVSTDAVTGMASATTYTTNWSLPSAVWTALPDGLSYISVSIYDTAGNYATSGPVFYVSKDTTGPAGGSISHLDGYTASAISVTFATGADAMSGYASYTLQRQTAAFSGGACGSYSGWLDLAQNPAASPYSDAAVSDSYCYQYRMLEADNLGNVATATAAATTVVDMTGPSPGTQTVSNSATNSHTGLSFDLSAAFTDAVSGLASCQYCVSTDGVCDTEWAAGVAGGGTCTKASLACADGQSLTLSMQGVDSVGNSSTTAAISRTCDGTLPVLTFNGPANGSTQTTSFTLDISESDAAAGLATCEYMVESDIAGWTTTKNWTSRTCNSASSVTVNYGPGLDCQTSGQNSCRVSVRATDAVGNVSAVTSYIYNSEDITAPSAPPAVSDGTGTDISFAASASQLSANWSDATDSESGISKYWYSIGTTAGASNVVSWTDNAAATSVTKTGLVLSEGQAYYFNVAAVNGAGLISAAVTSSNGQTVDSSAPANVTSVSDGTASDIAFTTSGTQLSANWSASSDAISGIGKYWYSIGTTAGASDVVSWTDNSTAVSVTKTGLVLTDGQTYYVSVQAENGAGIMSAGVATSNGQVVDSSAPSVVTVNDGTAADASFNTSLTQLSANWSDSADAHTGVAKYWYSVGTTAGASDVVSWTDNAAATSVTKTGLTLTNGVTYYVSVKAENGAGLYSTAANSNGQIAETTAPGVVTVNDGTGADSDYTTSTTQLSANWSDATDAESGVAKYWYSIGTTAGASDVTNWTDNGAATSVTKAGLTLTSGQAYYFSVKSENNLGMISTAANSDGITVDTSAPAAPASVNDGTGADSAYLSASDRVSANWSAGTDAESGIARYWYSVGTSAGASDVVTWTDNSTATSVTKTGLVLAAGTVYYVSVMAENNVGMVSGVSTSNGASLDTSAPSAVASVYDGTGADASIATSSTQLSANWTAATDAESGIAKYWYSIGTTAGASDVVSWTDNGSATGVTKTGLTLTEGATYYFSVKAENNASLLGTAANSNGATVDAASPTVSISSPVASANISGSVSVTGTVSDTTLSTWSLSYGPGASPTSWKEIASGTTAVSASTLGTFDATSLYGSYVLKLTASDQQGRSSETTVSVSANGSATVTGTVPKFKWVMLSAPLQPSATSPIGMFGSTGYYKVYRWDPTLADQQYFSKYAYPATISAGQGFWVGAFYDDLAYSYSGPLADSTGNYTVSLKSGWNQVGTPFNRNFSWSSVMVKYNGTSYDLATAASMGLISPNINGYDSTAGSWVAYDSTATLSPQAGYFVRAYQDVDLLFDPGAGMPGGLARVVRNVYGYKIELRASSKSSADNGSYAAVASGASAQYDTFDAEEPPASPGDKFTSVYFDDNGWQSRAGRYTADVRPLSTRAGQKESWAFKVDTNETGEAVTLTWGPGLPSADYSLTMTRLSTGETVDMSAADSYTFTAAANTDAPGGSKISSNAFRIDAVRLADAVAAVTRERDLPAGWSLVSVPVEPDVTAARSALSGLSSGAEVYQYYSGQFYQSAQADVQAGLGYWINSPEAARVRVTGHEAADTVTVPLKTGWNIIGNPFADALPWGDNVTFSCGGATYTLTQAVTAGITPGGLYSYDETTGYTAATALDPWIGYLLKVKSACELTLKR